MNPERLLQHFDRISEAPDAIPRLRRFILDLAVRGKLVEQDPNDEPAAELLKRIQAEKARLVKEGKARKGKLNTPLLDEDLPFDLPPVWRWSQLAAIGLISPRNDADGELPASFVPMTLIPAEYGASHTHEVRLWGEIKSGYTHFAEGDVALAKITPCFENGKSTVFRGLTGGIGAGTTELHVVRPLFINADFILLFLKCPYFIETGIPRMTGTAGQKRVPTDYFSYSPFPLPPLAEQHRIVAKVDELMALCDQLEAAKMAREHSRDRLVAASLHRLNSPADTVETDAPYLQARQTDAFRDHARFVFHHLPRLTTRPEHIKQLRQTILNLAVHGKLVPQAPNDEPVGELLHRVTAERQGLIAKGQLKAQKACTTVDVDLSSQPIPVTWKWMRLADLISFGPQNGISPKPTNNTESPKALTLTATTSGAFDVSYYKHVDLREVDCRNYWLSVGDVLFQRGNTREYVGIAAVFDGPEKSFVFPDLMIRVRFAEALSLRFIHMTLISPLLRRYFSVKATGASSSMPKISQGVLLNAPIPLPPLAEQHRIVARVDELMALCDQLEAQLTTTEVDSRRLLEAVLHEALNPLLEVTE